MSFGLTHTIVQRVARYLERLGLLVHDSGNDTKKFDNNGDQVLPLDDIA